MHCCLLLVKEYKYLGPVFDDKLTFEANTDIIRGKALQCVLRKLTTFRMDVSFMNIFYTCFITFVSSFSNICWYGNLNVKNWSKLNSIVKMCSKIVGTKLNILTRKGHLVHTMSPTHCVLNFNCFPQAGDLNSLCANQIDLRIILYLLNNVFKLLLINVCYLVSVVLLFMYVYCCVHKELPLRIIKLSKFNLILINFFCLHEWKKP